jgi:hypothetical protein
MAQMAQRAESHDVDFGRIVFLIIVGDSEGSVGIVKEFARAATLATAFYTTPVTRFFDECAEIVPVERIIVFFCHGTDTLPIVNI